MKLKVSLKKFKVTQIVKAKEILGFDEFVLRYVDAFIQMLSYKAEEAGGKVAMPVRTIGGYILSKLVHVC